MSKQVLFFHPISPEVRNTEDYLISQGCNIINLENPEQLKSIKEHSINGILVFNHIKVLLGNIIHILPFLGVQNVKPVLISKQPLNKKVLNKLKKLGVKNILFEPLPLKTLCFKLNLIIKAVKEQAPPPEENLKVEKNKKSVNQENKNPEKVKVKSKKNTNADPSLSSQNSISKDENNNDGDEQSIISETKTDSPHSVPNDQKDVLNLLSPQPEETENDNSPDLLSALDQNQDDDPIDAVEDTEPTDIVENTQSTSDPNLVLKGEDDIVNILNTDEERSDPELEDILSSGVNNKESETNEKTFEQKEDVPNLMNMLGNKAATEKDKQTTHFGAKEQNNEKNKSLSLNSSPTEEIDLLSKIDTSEEEQNSTDDIYNLNDVKQPVEKNHKYRDEKLDHSPMSGKSNTDSISTHYKGGLKSFQKNTTKRKGKAGPADNISKFYEGTLKKKKNGPPPVKSKSKDYVTDLAPKKINKNQTYTPQKANDQNSYSLSSQVNEVTKKVGDPQKACEPNTSNIDDTIKFYDKLSNKNINDKEILKNLCKKTYENFNGILIFFLKDFQKKIYYEWYNYSTKVNDGRIDITTDKNLWESIAQNNLTRWRETLQTAWSDPHFTKSNQEVIIPFFEDNEHLGFVIGKFYKKISIKNSLRIESLLANTRSLFLNQFKKFKKGKTKGSGMSNTVDWIKEKTTSIFKSVKSFFGW